MAAITREQRLALKRVYDRVPLNESLHLHQPGEKRISYRAFRRRCRKAGRLLDYCVMVPWCGMLLGIERDGYTHS